MHHHRHPPHTYEMIFHEKINVCALLWDRSKNRLVIKKVIFLFYDFSALKYNSQPIKYFKTFSQLLLLTQPTDRE